MIYGRIKMGENMKRKLKAITSIIFLTAHVPHLSPNPSKKGGMNDGI
jgi:hypothetical protein